MAQHPGAHRCTAGGVSGRVAPDPDERLLNGVLGQRLIPRYAYRQSVHRTLVAVIELGRRVLIGACREPLQERLVGDFPIAHNVSGPADA